MRGYKIGLTIFFLVALGTYIGLSMAHVSKEWTNGITVSIFALGFIVRLGSAYSMRRRCIKDAHRHKEKSEYSSLQP